jgi:hypothetical protein
MIKSAEEFVKLRSSEKPEEYNRAAWEEAPIEVWRDVISQYPDYKEWVVHNKTVPLVILSELIHDEDVRVREFIATKRKLTLEMQLILARDSSEDVRARLLFNPKLREETKELLKNDPSKFVRQLYEEKLQL